MIDDGRKMRYIWKRYDPDQRKKVEVEDVVMAPNRIADLNMTTSLPPGGYRCAVLAYVEAKRSFNYGSRKEKRAIELTLDVGGAKFGFAHWPDDNNELPEEVEDLESGSVVACLLTRRNPEKPFSIKKLEVLRRPPQKAAAEEEETSGEEDEQDRGVAAGVGNHPAAVQAEPG
jgi:hypothetical protein